MTDHKDLKNHIRERMSKTGEKYTAARRHVVATREATPPLEPAGKPETGRHRQAVPTWLDELAFWSHFPRNEPESAEVFAWCKEFADRFDNPGRLLDACAAVMTKGLQAFATAGLHRSTGGDTILDLTGLKDAPEGKRCDPPGTDHESMWLRGEEPEKFVSQPYTLDMETLRAMITYCRKRGLTFTIRGGSWHFPGSTVLVEFRRA